MPSMTVMKVFFRELFAQTMSARVPEPDLVMDNPENVAAYAYAGREDGSLQPIYLFQCVQICEVIRPGDTVVDLGCGPAVQLAMVARLNPEVKFIGVDLSDEMLENARGYIKKQNLTNVEFALADVTDLSCFEPGFADAVISTLVLHHLPDLDALERTFAEIRRILKPDGGLYLADLGHFKSDKSIEDFAYQYAHSQPEVFITDYLNSLRAAFYSSDFSNLYRRHLAGAGKFYTTFLLPYMMVVKSEPRRHAPSEELEQHFKDIKRRMSSAQQLDLRDLQLFFRLGGLKTPYLHQN